MPNKLRDIFYGGEKFKDIKLTDLDPCQNCSTHIDFMQTAIYGSIAERQYLETPEACKSCKERVIWNADCLLKLKWYEDQDPRFATKDQSPAKPQSKFV